MNKICEINTAITLLSNYQIAMNNIFARFLDLATELNTFISFSPHKPPKDGCLIDFLGGTKECTTSKIIEKIFNYTEGNHHILLESFIQHFLSSEKKVEFPIIRTEFAHFDISIMDKSYAIVIENKLKNAPFQRNQLARYVKKLCSNFHYNEKDIFIIILPKYANKNISLSVKCLPPDWNEINEKRVCAINQYDCWCDLGERTMCNEHREWCNQCDKEIINRLGKRLIILHDNFSEWLIEEAAKLPNQEWPMKTFILQFAYFLKGLYFTRLNDKLKMTIQNFLKNKILTGCNAKENWDCINETIFEIDQLRSSIEKLKEVVCNDMLKEWETELKNDYPTIQHDLQENLYSFGIYVNGIWIGCWSGAGQDNNNQPYWGFWCAQRPTKKQIKMISSILEYCGYSYELNCDSENDFIVLDNTLNGIIECRNLYEAAKSLGYL